MEKTESSGRLKKTNVPDTLEGNLSPQLVSGKHRLGGDSAPNPLSDLWFSPGIEVLLLHGYCCSL